MQITVTTDGAYTSVIMLYVDYKLTVVNHAMLQPVLNLVLSIPGRRTEGYL